MANDEEMSDASATKKQDLPVRTKPESKKSKSGASRFYEWRGKARPTINQHARPADLPADSKWCTHHALSNHSDDDCRVLINEKAINNGILPKELPFPLDDWKSKKQISREKHNAKQASIRRKVENANLFAEHVCR